MVRTRAVFVLSLVFLFLLLSFNAYACLLPLFGLSSGEMGGGCTQPNEEPARQFCDTFKTGGVQTKPGSVLDSVPIHCCESIHALVAPGFRPPKHHVQALSSLPVEDILIKVSLLRI